MSASWLSRLQRSAARRLSCSRSRRSNHCTWSGPTSRGSAASARHTWYSVCRRCVWCSSPAAVSCSRAYWRTDSSISSRMSGRAPGAWRRRLLSKSEATPSSEPAPATLSTASRVQPPTKMPSCRNRRCSAASSSWSLQSSAAHSVWCRSGRSCVSARNRSKRCSRRARIASGEKSLTRAAASSIASGRPSRRTQISATAAALPSDRLNSGMTARTLDEEGHRWNHRERLP